MSFQAAPHCQPNFPGEHDSVILVVILAAPVQAEIPTQKRVVFVSASVEMCVFLAQACPKREVAVRVGPRERLTLEYVRESYVPGKMGEDDARQGNAEMWRQVHSHVHDLSRYVLLDCPHSLSTGESRRHEADQSQV